MKKRTEKEEKNTMMHYIKEIKIEYQKEIKYIAKNQKLRKELIVIVEKEERMIQFLELKVE